MLRAVFNPELQLVASSAFTAGDRLVAAGEAFDWRAHGMTEIDVIPLFSTGLLVHADPPAQAARPSPKRSPRS